MSKRNVTFINEDFFYNPEHNIQSYYQVCLYKDETKGMYGIRKIKFNEKMEILSAKIKHYPKKILDKFVEKHKNLKENKIKLYPYNNINIVPYPTMSDLNASFSGLLNSRGDYYGFANI